MAVTVHIKDKAIQIGVIADREALAAQAAAIHTLAGQQVFPEPAAADRLAVAIGADLNLGDPAVLVGALDGEPAVGVHACQVDAQLVADAVFQRLAGEAGRAAGIAVGVPVAGNLLVVGAVHGLQPGALTAPDFGRRGCTRAGRGEIRREADLPIVSHQHMGNLLGSGQRSCARLCTQHRRIARLA